MDVFLEESFPQMFRFKMQRLKETRRQKVMFAGCFLLEAPLFNRFTALRQIFKQMIF